MGFQSTRNGLIETGRLSARQGFPKGSAFNVGDSGRLAANFLPGANVEIKLLKIFERKANAYKLAKSEANANLYARVLVKPNLNDKRKSFYGVYGVDSVTFKR